MYIKHKLIYNQHSLIPQSSKKQKSAVINDIIRIGMKQDWDYDYTPCIILKNRTIHDNYSKGKLKTQPIMTNIDYREVVIKPNSVVYCDIPYKTSDNLKNTKNKKGYYGVKFDWVAFFDWASTRDFPVYFSEYECSDDRFQCVLEVEKRNTLGGNKLSIERLFWNGIEVTNENNYINIGVNNERKMESFQQLHQRQDNVYSSPHD